MYQVGGGVRGREEGRLHHVSGGRGVRDEARVVDRTPPPAAAASPPCLPTEHCRYSLVPEYAARTADWLTNFELSPRR